MSTVTYVEILAKLKDAVRWIELAAGKKAKGRLPHYVKILEKVVIGKTNARVADEVLPQFMPIIPDVFRIISIYEAFSPHSTIPWVTEKLWLLTSGATFPEDEGTSGNSVLARNTAFEFIVGSILLRDGWLPRSVANKSDGAFTKSGHLLRIEAKRVQSASQLNKNISKAEKQIEARQTWEENNAPFGLIALDVTRLMNKGQMYMKAKSESAALTILRRGMEKVCAVSNPRPFKNSLLLGTILYADAPVLLLSKNQLTHVGQIDFLINGSKTAFYKHVADKLFKSVKGITRPF